MKLSTNRVCTVGIDLGTSGVKVALVGLDGHPMAVATRTYPVMSPHEGWAESDPNDWLAAAQQALSDVVSRLPEAEICALAIDGQMHGIVFTAIDGSPVRPAILWPDTRAIAEVATWAADLEESVKAELANPLTPGMAGPIISWFTRHQPEVIGASHTVLFAKDWLRAQLLPGSFMTDPSDASASLLWNVADDGWHEELLEKTGAPRSMFPPVHDSIEIAGHLGPAIAALWKLPVGIPIAVGSSDVAATLCGLNRNSDGTMSLIMGTGAQVLMDGIVPRTTSTPAFHTYRSWDGASFAMAAVTNGGLALQRICELLNASWDELYRSATYQPNAATPFFLPFFTGERFVEGANSGCASWTGIGLSATRADLLYASVEGVVFSVARAIQAMPQPEDQVVNIVGGGVAHKDFVQLLADALERPLRPIAVENVTAVGAARLAARAAGHAAKPSQMPGGTIILPRRRAGIRRRRRDFDLRVAELQPADTHG